MRARWRKWAAAAAGALLLLAPLVPLAGSAQAASGQASAPSGQAQVPFSAGPAPDTGEAPPPEWAVRGGDVGIQSYSPSGDAAADEAFYTDSHPSLDQYTYRSGSPIRFPIMVDRYFGPVDGSGQLLHPENVDGESLRLKLRVWDVDQSTSTDECAPEVDKVYFNGTLVGTLSGANSQWSAPSFDVPLNLVKFPSYSVAGGVQPAENTVEVHVDTANAGGYECWAVTVDWGELVIKGIRPAVLVHGFLSSAGTWSRWENSFAPEAGLPVMSFSFGSSSGSMFLHAREEAGYIEQAKEQFGVEQLNIMSHSKGGLDSRAYLALGGDDVQNLIMMGTPNAGSPLADLAEIGSFFFPAARRVVSLIGEPALTELTVTFMNLIGNRVIGSNPNTDYHTIAGVWTWKGYSNPLIPGDDDGVVGVSSVEALPYTHSLGHTPDGHLAQTGSRAAWDRARSTLVEIAAAPAVEGPRLAFAGGRLVSGDEPAISLSSLQGLTVSEGTQTSTVAVSGENPVTLGVMWAEGSLDLTLVSPSGAIVTEGDFGVEVAENTDPQLGFSYIFYRIAAPEAGTYTLHVTAETGSPVGYLTVGAVEGGPVFSAAARETFVPAGEDVVLEAALDWNGAAAVPVTVTAHVQQPDGEAAQVELVDDGSGADHTAGDGVYAGVYTPEAGSGYHAVAVVARATDPAHSFTRLAAAGFQVVAGEEAFAGAIGHEGVDENGDGLYDRLDISTGVLASARGEYLVMAQLTNAAGETLVRAGRPVKLSSGTNTVTLSFDGWTLGESRFEGDLILTDLALVRPDGSIADFVAPAATLTGYDYTQFQRRPIQVLEGIDDYGMDTDGNGLYDWLVVEIPVDVVYAGTYQANARLVDWNGNEIVWAATMVSLPAGPSTLALRFQGKAIGEHGVDGPYRVEDLAMYRSYGAETLSITDLHTTAPYAVTDFAGAASFPGLLERIDAYLAEGLIGNAGIARSLQAKVESAWQAAERGQPQTARNILNALVQEIEAQSGKQIDEEAAQALMRYAEVLGSRLP